MKGYRDLLAWQKGMDLVVDVYKLTQRFPKEEMYGLTSQMRRAAVSIPSNLAEGQGRSSKREFHQFVSMARGSLLELETQLELAVRLGLVPAGEARIRYAQMNQLSKILAGLREWAKKE